MRKFTIVLTVLVALAITTNGQIPNSGFENWTTVGSYENPTGWATWNSYAAGPFYSCTKSSDHYPASVGNYSIRLENNTSLTQLTGGLGMAMTDTFAYPFQPAFPISGHPTSLCGYYKYMPQNSDTMWIRIILFNNGSIVMDEQITYNATASTWTPFTIPFDTYTNADSAAILISAFLPQGATPVPYGNSVLYVDNLNFDSFIASVSEQTSVNTAFSLYPNPASDIVTLNINNANNADLTLNIYNVIGTLVKSEILKQYNRQINIGDLCDGIYMVEIKTKEWTKKQKLIIQK
ncbi:MAG: T9SS type A sorting domain-containing protein [Paludibacter sp.]|nr:T9SS type A sorting domain-containing protein [Paludibacter sp.]